MWHTFLVIWFGGSAVAIIGLLVAFYAQAKQLEETRAKNVMYESALDISRDVDRSRARHR